MCITLKRLKQTVEGLLKAVASATLPWGGYGGSFADPDGYVWSIGYSAQGKDQSYAE